MAEVVAISLEVDSGNSVNEVKRLEIEVSNLIDETNDLRSINNDFKTELSQLTKEYEKMPKMALAGKKAIKVQMDELKNSIKDNNLALQDFRLKKQQKNKLISDIKLVQKQSEASIKAVGNIAKSVGTGYQAFLGVSALIGSENEDIMRSLQKLQGVQATLNALEKISIDLQKQSTFRKSLDNVATKVKTGLNWLLAGSIKVVNGALKSLRGALIATGLGALIVLIGTIIAKWDDWKDSIISFIKGALSPLIDALKYLGIVESDLEKERRTNHENEMRRIQERRDSLGSVRDKAEQDLKNEIAIANARGENTDKSQKKLLKLTRDNAQKRIDDNNALIEEIDNGNRVATEEEYKNANDSIIADRKLREGAEQDLKLFDATKSKERREARKVQSDKDKEDSEKFESEKQAKLKELNDEFKDLQNKEIEDGNNRAITQLETEQQREKDSLIKKFGEGTELEKQLLINQKSEMDALKEEHRLTDEEKLKENLAIINGILAQHNLDSIENTFDKARKELEIAKNTELDKLKLAKATQEQINQINKSYTEKSKKISEDESKFKKKLKQTEIQQALDASSQVLGSIVSLVGEGSKIGKAAAIAQTTIDTYSSATAAYSSVVGTPFVGPILAPIAAGVAVASGMASIRKIMATKIPGGGVSGGSGVTPPTYAKPSTDTSTINSQSTNGDGSGGFNLPTNRVVLVESDLRMMQERRNNSDIISTI